MSRSGPLAPISERIPRSLKGDAFNIRFQKREKLIATMSVVKHKELNEYLKALAAGDAPGIFLIHGEELLVKTTLEALMAALLPGDARDLNYEPMDGGAGSVAAALEKVNTFSLMAEPKVVALLDAQVFYSKQDTTAILGRARTAHKRNEMRKAAQALLKAMALLNLTFDDLTPELRANALKLTEEQRRDDVWLTALLDYCREQNLSVPADSSEADILQAAVARGFPDQQYLIVTTDIVDRRRNLYKTIADKGLVIDCAVPKGDRKADRTAQTAVLNEQLAQVLQSCGKKMAPDARALLGELAGFNLRAITNSVKQLASYIGDRDTIETEDVRRIVRKTRQDPIYNFTNAFTDRDRAAALQFLNSLLAENLYPLQLLAAMVNQIRKLIHIKGFAESRFGNVWQRGCQYTYFRDQVMPAIVDYDQRQKSRVSSWEAAFSADDSKKSGPQKKAAKATGDLLIARNPKNPYPVYQLFTKAERFTMSELMRYLELLEKADQRLKSTSLAPRLVLEEAILSICR